MAAFAGTPHAIRITSHVLLWTQQVLLFSEAVSVLEGPTAWDRGRALCLPGAGSPGRGVVASASPAVSREAPPGSDVTVGPAPARVLGSPLCEQTGPGRHLQSLEDGVGGELLWFFKFLVRSLFSHKSSPLTTLCVSEDSGSRVAAKPS